jgi:hypothetical protein
MVNALQRHATVVTQKSLAEGFGLTVAEGMWKARPVIGSAVGGIIDQIAPGTGILLPDPHDLEAFGAAVRRLLDNPGEASQIGRAAQSHLADRSLVAAVLQIRMFCTTVRAQDHRAEGAQSAARNQPASVSAVAGLVRVEQGSGYERQKR